MSPGSNTSMDHFDLTILTFQVVILSNFNCNDMRVFHKEQNSEIVSM